MTEFEAGIRRALEIYQAGVRGDPVPRLPQVAKRDAQEIYTAGFIDAANELDTLTEIQPPIARWLMSFTDPKATADRACRLASQYK